MDSSNGLTTTQQVEKSRFEYLLKTDAGKWILQELIRQSNALAIFCSQSGGASASEIAYYKGRHDLIQSCIVQKLVKYFGYKALDDVMDRELRNV